MKIASGKFHGRDAGEHPAAVQAQLVLLAGRAGQRQRPGELAPRFGRVEAQEIDRLAHFEHRVDQGLPGLADAQREEFLAHAPRRGRRRGRAAGRAPRRRARPSPTCAAWPARTIRSTSSALASNTVPTSIRRSCGEVIGPAPCPFPSVGLAVQLRLSSAFSRSSSGSRTSGSERSTPALLRRSAPNISRGRTIFGLRLGSSAVELGDRIADQLVERHLLVGDAVDEAGVGAVLEQPADEIGEQLLVAADRRVDAHRRRARRRSPASSLRQLLVQLLAHAVQPLELERPALRPAPSPGRSCWRCGSRTPGR